MKTRLDIVERFESYVCTGCVIWGLLLRVRMEALVMES